MNVFQRKVALRVTLIHVAVILFFGLISFLKGCFRPKPPPEIVTMIEFGSPAPAVEVQEVDDMRDPERAEEPAPPDDPVPAEPPPTETVPEQQKKIIKPPIKTDPPKLTKKDPPKQKQKLATVDDIKIGKKVGPTQPPVSEKEIKQALSGVVGETKTPGPVGNPNAISAYDSHIYSVFYNAWERPSVPGIRPAKVTISISSSGRITSSRLSQSSVDSAFDASVMAAVGRVKLLPKKPPTGYPLDNIVVQFRIID